MRASELSVTLKTAYSSDLEIIDVSQGFTKRIQVPLDASPDSPEGRKSPLSEGERQDNHVQKAGNQVSPRQKCGRPANPIPRHKRDSHIKAEYKRRDKIQIYDTKKQNHRVVRWSEIGTEKGFETLKTLVPELAESNTNKESKSAMLFKTAEHCLRLKAQCGEVQNEAASLRQELEALGSEIHDLQERLPEHGIEMAEKPTSDMDSLYDQYVQQETKKNWKFWIFSYFMRPLYKTYRQVMSAAMTPQKFNVAVGDWMKDCLSLSNLRRGFLDALRKISTQTSIMSSPEKLQEECLMMADPATRSHLMQTKSAESEIMKPPQTPSISNKSKSRPSTPPSSIGNSQGVGHKSRSRPSTPPLKEGGVKQRRRSSNRSEKGSAPVSPHNNNPEEMCFSSSRKFEPSISVGSQIPQSLVSPQVSLDNDTIPIFLDDKMITTIVQSLMTDVSQSSVSFATLGSSSASQLCTAQPSYPHMGADLKPLITNHNASEQNLFLASSSATKPAFSFTSPKLQNQTSFLESRNGLSLNIALAQSSGLSPQASESSAIPVTVREVMMEQSVPVEMQTVTTPIHSSEEMVQPVFSHIPVSEQSTISNGYHETLFDAIETDEIHTSLENTLASFQTGEPTVTSPAHGHHGVSLTNGSQQVDQTSAMDDDDSLMRFVSLDLMDMNKLMSLLSETDDMSIDNSLEVEIPKLSTSNS